MNPRNRILLLPALSAFALASSCSGQQATDKPPAASKTRLARPDTSKSLVEMPIKVVLDDTTRFRADISKVAVERPIKLVFSRESTLPDLAKVAVETPIKTRFGREAARRLTTTKKVAPGTLPWHENLAAARAAAKRSGKAVLHFQLLGRLDEEFC